MIVIVGESGCGKSTLVKDFISQNPEYHRIVTYTTRPIRPGEKDGVDYHFVSVEKFKQLAKDNFFVEYAEYRGWLYGTPFEPFQMDFSHDIAIITPTGLRRLKQLNYDVYSIYLCVDRASRLISLINRGDDIDEAYRRNLSDVGMFDGIENEVDRTIRNLKFHKSRNEVLKELQSTVIWNVWNGV